MSAGSELTIRAVKLGDRSQLASMVHFELNVHRHLEWRTPIEWIGSQPFLLLEDQGRLVGALACPPDPEPVAWIHLFLAVSTLPVGEAWQILWPVARQQLAERRQVRYVAALPLHGWFEKLLVAHSFVAANRVVMLSCQLHESPGRHLPAQVSLRTMNKADLLDVCQIDNAAFEPLWQNSQKSLELALKQAAWATVAESQGMLVGYQISTATALGGHLARLAVLPEFQSQGIGHLLVQDVLAEFYQRGMQSVSVNTQKNNIASLTIYQQEGFILTGEEYPVYQYNL